MTGKTEKSREKRAKSRRRPSRLSFALSPSHFAPKGFTLLELMIVISIIIILVSVALPQYQKTIMHARETMLRYDLDTMRKLIDQYAADKGKLPTSLQDLVTAGYMREIPTDPLTDQKDWQEDQGEDVNSTEGGTGLVDVHSKATEADPQGRPYSEY